MDSTDFLEEQHGKFLAALVDHDLLKVEQIKTFQEEGRSEEEAIEMTNAMICGRLSLHGADLITAADSSGNVERRIVPAKSKARPGSRKRRWGPTSKARPEKTSLAQPTTFYSDAGQLYTREQSLTKQYLPLTSKSRSVDQGPDQKYQKASDPDCSPAKLHYLQFFNAVCADLGPELAPTATENSFAIDDLLEYDKEITSIKIAELCAGKLPYENEYADTDFCTCCMKKSSGHVHPCLVCNEGLCVDCRNEVYPCAGENDEPLFDVDHP